MRLAVCKSKTMPNIYVFPVWQRPNAVCNSASVSRSMQICSGNLILGSAMRFSTVSSLYHRIVHPNRQSARAEIGCVSSSILHPGCIGVLNQSLLSCSSPACVKAQSCSFVSDSIDAVIGQALLPRNIHVTLNKVLNQFGELPTQFRCRTWKSRIYHRKLSQSNGCALPPFVMLSIMARVICRVASSVVGVCVWIPAFISRSISIKAA